MFHNDPLSKPHRTATLFLAMLPFFAGCPQTSPDALRIERTEVEGNEFGEEFDVKVTGGGFIRAVNYDLAAKQGTVVTNNLSVEIRGNGGYSQRHDFTVLNGTTMRVQVRGGPLPPQIYEIALYLDEKEQTSATLFSLVEGSDRDGGFRDGGVGDPSDGGGDVDGGGPPRDGGPGRDAGFRDGGPPDSGLGEFEGAFGFRRQILVSSATTAPANVTIRVPVPHATFVTAGQSLDTALDLAVYQGKDQLEYAFDDRFLVNTDQLVLIAKLLRDLPATGALGEDALTLYYGDPAAQIQPNEAVFEFVERFDAQVSPINSGNDNAWSVNNWERCNNARPSEATEPNARTYCVFDDDNLNPLRRTLASPRMRTLRDNEPTNIVFETSFWLAGQMRDGTDDIFYFSQGPNNDNFAITVLFAPTDFNEFPPNGTLTFEETNNANRTVQGWQFPAAAVQWWTRARLRFRPAVDQPSLHFRYISANPNQYNPGESGMVLDDWWIRRALEPAPTVTLGAEESR